MGLAVKSNIVTTSRSNWIVGIQTHHGNPYDGHAQVYIANRFKKKTKQWFSKMVEEKKRNRTNLWSLKIGQPS
jgi:hypothetical protein